MAAKRYAGLFHAGYDKAPQYWRVTTNELVTVLDVTRVLGGKWGRCSSGAGHWNVWTMGSQAEIALVEVAENHVAFRLPAIRDSLPFFLDFSPWSMREVTCRSKEDFSDSGASARLSIEPVEFRTCNGLEVLYQVPKLYVPDPRALMIRAADG